MSDTQPHPMQEVMAAWWDRLDPSMQDVLQRIFEKAPAQVTEVITNGGWTVPDSTVPLSVLYTVGSGFASPTMWSNYWLSPEVVLPNQPFKLSATVSAGSGGMAATTATLTATGLDGRPIHVVAPLPELSDFGSETTIEFEVPPQPEPGWLQLVVLANPEGAPQGSPPNANGNQLTFTYPVEVQSVEYAAETQDFQLVGYVVGHLTAAVGTERDSVVSAVKEALNNAAGLDATADVAGELYPLVERIDDTNFALPAVQTALGSISVAANRIGTLNPGEQPAAIAQALEQFKADLAAALGN